MADFAKRAEVTIETMGRVSNPSGAGVRSTSAQVQAKTQARLEREAANAAAGAEGGETTGSPTNSSHNGSSHTKKPHPPTTIAAGVPATTGTAEGSARRNIARRHTADRPHRYDSAHKKQGGHGKGQWRHDQHLGDAAAVAAEYYSEHGSEDARGLVLDESDPLYMADEDSNRYILTSDGAAAADAQPRGRDPTSARAVYGPLLTLPEFKIQVADCLQEYLLDSCDADEVIRRLAELGCPEYHAQVLVKKIVSLSLDRGPREREWASRLLTCLHPVPMSLDELQIGFQVLLDSMEDLSKDVPDAVNMVACFLARAVVDEVLPPAFLSQENNSRPGDPVIARAIGLLSREHSTARLEKIWGPGDGRPVEELKRDMDQLLQEYLASRELDEAARCVKELDAKHFHHELVKRGVMCAMEKDGAKHTGNGANHHATADASGNGANGDEELSNLDAMAALFGFLVRNAIVSENQVKKGVVRLHQLLDDIQLDVPSAPALLASFETMAMQEGCLPTTGLSSADLAKRESTPGEPASESLS